MANEILYKVGTSLLFSNSTYSPTAARSMGTYQAANDIDVASLAAAAARQSTKGDFTSVRAMLYDVRMTFEIASDPAAGGTVDIYASPSHSGTANVGNVGHCTGADAAYAAIAGYTLDELLAHLQFIGSAPVAIQNDADGVQHANVGTWSPTARYNSIVVVNNCSVAFHSDSVEFAILFEPIIAEIQ